MGQTITNHTTYDQAYYYADIHHLPRLSDEEQQALIRTASPAAPHLNTKARNRLIEGHLGLAKYFAIKECPPSCSRLLPDIIGEVNLRLVRIADRYDFSKDGDFTAYFAACAQGIAKGCIASDRLIKIPESARQKAKQQGTEQELYRLQPVSLDELMEWSDTDKEEEPPTAPLLPTEPAPPRDSQLHAQVETYLSYLPPRAQAVLRLRYGLDDNDERRHTTAEIVSILGINPQLVLQAERDAITRLQALVAGKATLAKRNGKLCISYPEMYDKHPVTLGCEAILMQAAARLREQGIKLSGSRLAKETGESVHIARAFLHSHPDLVAPQTQRETRQARLEQICAELEAQGTWVSAERLSKVAHIGYETAQEFIRSRSQGMTPQEFRAQQRQLRLEEAYSKLMALGKPFGHAPLAKEARVGHLAARIFLKERRSKCDATA
jgi:RNA polymerase sigma factor (sigma-70 family)